MSSTSARRSNTTWSWRTESAGWWRRQITAVRRSSRPASACGSVRRQRAAWRCSHHRLVALDGRAQHVPAVLGIVERRGAMLRAAVVPEHGVVQPPAVAVDELRAHGEFLEVLDQLGAFFLGHAFDGARPAPYVQRSPARFRMAALERVPDVGLLELVVLGERRQVRVVHMVQPGAAEAGTLSADFVLHFYWKSLIGRIHVGKQRVSALGR